MLVRIRDNWVYGGFLAALMLFALTPVLAASWSLPLLLIWVQLPVYMLHQYEEHDGDRFRLFINAHIGGGREVLSPFAVFMINIAGVWGVDVAAFVLATQIRVGLGLIAVYLSLINGVSHCVMAIAMQRYNPGLITSVLLFIPLGIATLAILAQGAPIRAVDQAVSVAVALLIHAGIVALILLRRAQFSMRKY